MAFGRQDGVAEKQKKMSPFKEKVIEAARDDATTSVDEDDDNDDTFWMHGFVYYFYAFGLYMV